MEVRSVVRQERWSQVGTVHHDGSVDGRGGGRQEEGRGRDTREGSCRSVVGGGRVEHGKDR